MKFNDMKYEKLEVEDIIEKISSLNEKFNKAETKDEVLAVYKEYDEHSKYVQSMYHIAYIRNTIDTTDQYYSEQKEYWNNTFPLIQEASQKFEESLLNSKFRKDLELEWGNIMFLNMELSQKAFSPEIVPMLQEENKLTAEYQKLMASFQVEFDGKTLTMPQLFAYSQSPDKDIRKSAVEAISSWMNDRKLELDRIFDSLVKVRTEIAKELGYESFTQVGYYRMNRNSYDEKMVKRFREGVVKHIVPLTIKLKEQHAERIGVEKITAYDTFFLYPQGNPKPKGTPEEILAHGKRIYEELSEETKEFINFMIENDLFDVLSKPGKAVGGYCAEIPIYNAPFIFANFNGTVSDVNVLTHEVGHAFADYTSKNIYPTALRRYSFDIAEIHSMAMEFLTWPWMEGFFGEETETYYEMHLASALEMIPYGTMVDEFQHHIYEKPDITIDERNTLWLELEAKYRPWLHNEGIPFYEDGRLWQRQTHIYTSPFYYIDYCLSQIIALSFWALSQKSYSDAWEKYLRLTRLAGTRTFVDLIENADLPSPFVPDNLKLITDVAVERLDKK